MLRPMSGESPRLSTWESLKAVTRSWRLLSVVLLSFSSGLPLGLVWVAIPTWLTQEGVDIRLVGLFQLTQLPWSFKFLWSPLMDRFPIPIGPDPEYKRRTREQWGWLLLKDGKRDGR